MHPVQDALIGLISKKNIGSLTLREIGELIHEPDQPQKIKHHLNQLAKNGLIRIDKRRKSIEKTSSGFDTQNKIISIPIYGSANCGQALRLADQYAEGFLKLSKKILISKNPKLFAIKAIGHSMNRANIGGENIEEGDYVLIDPNQKSPRNGDYVLSIIDGMANIKKFSLSKGKKIIALISESSKQEPPILLHESDLSGYLVGGKVVQVIKY